MSDGILNEIEELTYESRTNEVHDKLDARVMALAEKIKARTWDESCLIGQAWEAMLVRTGTQEDYGVFAHLLPTKLRKCA